MNQNEDERRQKWPRGWLARISDNDSLSFYRLVTLRVVSLGKPLAMSLRGTGPGLPFSTLVQVISMWLIRNSMNSVSHAACRPY